LHSFGDTTTFTAYVTAHDLEKSFSTDMTVNSKATLLSNIYVNVSYLTHAILNEA